MGELRAPLPEEVHRLLKEEAARKGLHLKDLVAAVLKEHTEKEVGEKNSTKVA